MRRPQSILAVLALLLSAAPLAAQTIEDARTVSLADDGTTYAASFGGIHRYDEAAGTWPELVGTFSGYFFDIAAGPGGHIWGGSGGVYGSLDGGQTWDWDPIHVSQHSGTPASIFTVAVGPDETVYAWGWRSTNLGQTWQAMSWGLKATAFVGATVYAGTIDGIYRSTNSGASWTSSGLNGTEVDALAASTAGFAAATDDAGLWHSADGVTWTAVATLAGVRSLAATSDGAFWAAGGVLGGPLDGLHRSADGTAWPSAPAAFAGQEVTDVAARGLTVLAAVDGVPYRSTDGGLTWVALTGGAGAVGTAYCFGDGSGTPCPCGNPGSPGHGCGNGSDGGGARLSATGSASVSASDLVLVGEFLPPGQLGLYFQGDSAVSGGHGVVFGGGLRCAGDGVLRLQALLASPGGMSSTTVDVSSVGGVSPGDVRRYQLWYRDAADPCGAGFNLTNGLEVVWQP